MVYLILWIVSLLALILYLLIVEYLHEEMKKKSVLGEMSSEELMKIFEGGEQQMKKHSENFHRRRETDSQKCNRNDCCQSVSLSFRVCMHGLILRQAGTRITIREI